MINSRANPTRTRLRIKAVRDITVTVTVTDLFLTDLLSFLCRTRAQCTYLKNLVIQCLTVWGSFSQIGQLSDFSTPFLCSFAARS